MSAFGIDADDDMHGVVAAVCRDGIVAAAIDAQSFKRRRLGVRLQPFRLEIFAAFGTRLLLVQRAPFVRVVARFDHLAFGEPFRPEPLAGLSSQRIIVAGNHRQLDMPPVEAQRRIALHQSANQIQFVKPRADNDALRIGLKSRHKVAAVPFPYIVKHQRALCVFEPWEWVFDNAEIGALAGNTNTDTNSTITAATR